jgi:hypothetical protein
MRTYSVSLTFSDSSTVSFFTILPRIRCALVLVRKLLLGHQLVEVNLGTVV